MYSIQRVNLYEYANYTTYDCWFNNHIEIAQIVHTEPRNVKLSIERLAQKDVIQLPPMAKVENKQSLSPNRFSDTTFLAVKC